MEAFARAFEKYPWIIVGIIAVVVFVAWRGQGTDNTPQLAMTGGGVRSLPVDPGTVQIETNRQNTTAQNISTISSLLLGERQSGDALSSSLAQTSAAENVALAESAAQTTQAQIAAAYNAAANAANNAAAIERAKLDSTTAITTNRDNNQTSKDIARARDNTDIVNTIFGGVLRFFGGFF